jgi:hypothetical protein
MKTIALLFLAVLIAVVACQPAPMATPAPTNAPLPTNTLLPTATPTLTNTPTATATLTATATATATPKPTIEGMKDVTYPDSKLLAGVIQLYAKAIGLDSEKAQVAYKQFKDYQGNPFVVGISQDGTPLVIASQSKDGKWEWSEATPGKLADKKGMKVGISYGYVHVTGVIEASKKNSISISQVMTSSGRIQNQNLGKLRFLTAMLNQTSKLVAPLKQIRT